MNLPHLLARIQRGEDLHTEFKQTDAHADDLSAALVAFANTDGGQLIFDVADDRRIKDVSDPDHLTSKILP